MSDGPKLLERLRKFAVRLRVPVDDQWDLAFDAYVKALESGVPEWHFASACLKNLWLRRQRDERRRKTGQFSYWDGDAEPIEYRQMVAGPGQVEALALKETLETLGTLDESYRNVMHMVAEGWEPDEIASHLGMPLSEVYWRTQRARKLLRDAGHHDLPPKRGHSKYIGVRRDHHKFVASIRDKGSYFHLGYFDTSEEAARAYDKKAKELRGPLAKVNFPLSPDPGRDK